MFSIVCVVDVILFLAVSCNTQSFLLSVVLCVRLSGFWLVLYLFDFLFLRLVGSTLLLFFVFFVFSSFLNSMVSLPLCVLVFNFFPIR